jgi:hypothetical protein
MCKTWGAALTGGFLIAILGSWQFTGHNIAPRVGWTVIMGGIVVAAFQVWNRQFDAMEQLRAELTSESEKLRAELALANEPSKLLIRQKKGYEGIKGGGATPFVHLTILASNQSNKPNSIVEYEAEIMKTDGTYESLRVEQGTMGESDFGVVPLNIPASTTVEARLVFLSLHLAKYGQPFKFRLTAVDMHGKKFTGDVQF